MRPCAALSVWTSEVKLVPRITIPEYVWPQVLSGLLTGGGGGSVMWLYGHRDDKESALWSPYIYIYIYTYIYIYIYVIHDTCDSSLYTGILYLLRYIYTGWTLLADRLFFICAL